MTLLIFFLILSFLILIHEFGHFYAAKKSGVAVHEFGLGLPPKVIGKKFGETEYTLNLLPIGGFVRIEGEDPSEEIEDPKRNFQTKPSYIKLIILLAGVFMNFLLAVVLFYAYFFGNNFLSNPLIKFNDFNFIGANEQEINTVISGVENEELKEKVQNGDVVFNVETRENSLNNLTPESLKSLNKREYLKDLSTVELKEFQDFINESEGPMTLYIYNIQNNEFKQVEAEAKNDEELNRKVLGVYLGSLLYLDYGENTTSKALSGVTHSYNILGYSMKTFSQIIYQSFAQRDVSTVSSGVSGPVGIFSVVQSVLTSDVGNVIWVLIDLIAILSLSLALMNILPIPALDGGRAIFVLYEGITRKKVNPKIESQAHKLGMMFLLLLLALITLKDVINLF